MSSEQADAILNGQPLQAPVRAGRWRVLDRDGTLLGFVVIDRIVAGRSCGGIRAGPRVTMDEIARIARVMTLKCAFSGLAAGGAKGGVIVPRQFDAERRSQRLRAFGRSVAPLLRTGVWSHGADMGTTERDIAIIRHAAGLGADPEVEIGSQPSSSADFSSGRAAGLTTALAAEAALTSVGIAPRGARIAVQGAGAVGRAAARALAAGGARIVAVSTIAGALLADGGLDVESVFERLDRAPDERLDEMRAAEALFGADCDALLLCAGSDVLDRESARRLNAPVVVCGANIPFDEDVAAVLDARGIVVIPDFVAGAGGVLGSTLAAASGAGIEDVEHFLRRHFRALVVDALAQAAARGTPVAVQARRHAEGVIAAFERLYADERPPTLLPDRLVEEPSLPARLMLDAERRLRGSPRWSLVSRPLRKMALERAERVLTAAFALGARA